MAASRTPRSAAPCSKPCWCWWCRLVRASFCHSALHRARRCREERAGHRGPRAEQGSAVPRAHSWFGGARVKWLLTPSPASFSVNTQF